MLCTCTCEHIWSLDEGGVKMVDGEEYMYTYTHCVHAVQEVYMLKH